ncbi:heme-binding protein (plasmid) [Streptomyces sp. NBC_01450]|uniref:GlcG/HbpS family heme-binding protein n=1 Tax=Streptomyces sp. NBC_01450 TaxID=2903871 RepID=UPI002E3795DA|nr:heme-binding protein [Streptomyces sp. NBC_01450]
MSHVVTGLRLTEQATLTILNAAVEEARKREAPVAIAVVDTSGQLRAFVLMDDAVPFAQEVVPKKARTAAYVGSPTGEMDPALAARLAAAATDFTDLRGGLPIVVDGVVVGGIAASGSSSDNDVAIAQAGLDVLT